MRFYYVAILSFLLSSVNALNGLNARALLDVCAEVDAELMISNAIGTPVVFGVVDACICLSVLPLFIEVNAVAQAGVLLFGKTKVIAALTALINGAPGSQQCNYPDNCSPICVSGNPCSFTCINGFTPSPDSSSPSSCVCESPNTVCNGQCGYFPSCPSAQAKRSLLDRHARRNHWARDNICRAGSTICPVFGHGKASWECVDTMSDLESCGGCIYSGVDDGPVGVDCSAIEGVSDVACQHGQCVVNLCMPGYKANADHSLCIGDGRSGFEASADILAVEFGL